MSNAYDPARIEARWQAYWEENETFRATNPGEPGFDSDQPKYYALDMFPYPSGAGLHVGHPIGYIGSDAVARRQRMLGCNVLHPMGYDAFGLPAEQYAIKTGKHPSETTRENIANYRRQLKMLGLSYDWTRELSTADPAFYRWTQWIFLRLFDRGLVYQAEVPVWWCEALKTVLSNEEVINGRSERGDHPCMRRPLKQWMLKITAYADRLLDDLEGVDWPESIKTQQREWIGRSQGAEIDFPIEGHDGHSLKVFTTRPDTTFGATFLVVAPEHPLVAEITTDAQRAEVDAYVARAATKSDLERTDLAKEKTGVFTGAHARNPLAVEGAGDWPVPIWVADYVLTSYGTGAIMAVPGGDDRDFEFALEFDLPIVQVVRPPEGAEPTQVAEHDPQVVCYPGHGTAVCSGPLDGLPSEQAIPRSIELLERAGAGRARTNYRLRDWLFSRQRYWGEPFPLLHRSDGTVVRVPDADLPVELPDMQDFQPAADGSPPLARVREWVETIDPESGEPALRDTDSMPGWAGSCWYYLRYMDPTNQRLPFAPEAERYWGPVDLYIGGTEHAVLHLLYARFWHKVLYDEGVVSTPEPFRRLFNQGMITAFAYRDENGRLVSADEVVEDGEQARLAAGGAPLERVVAKMSKSLHNVVNPDVVCGEFGVDTFRLYEMFMGPLSDSKPWNPRDVPGCRRFLDRAWRMLVDPEGEGPVRPELAADPPGKTLTGEALELERHLHRALQRIEDSFQHFNFNTAVAALMTFVNEVNRRPGALRRDQAERFVQALAPFAPHVAEELWRRLGHGESIARAPWPEVRAEYLEDESYELVVQVNGKRRGKALAPRSASKGELEALARDAVPDWLSSGEVAKTIVVPGKLVNFVVR